MKTARHTSIYTGETNSDQHPEQCLVLLFLSNPTRFYDWSSVQDKSPNPIFQKGWCGGILMAPWENGCLSIEAHPPPCLPPAKKPAVKVHAGPRSISWLSCWATRLDGQHAGRRPSESWCHRKRGHITWPDKVSFLRDDEGTACSTNSTSGWTKLWRARGRGKKKKLLHAFVQMS